MIIFLVDLKRFVKKPPVLIRSRRIWFQFRFALFMNFLISKKWLKIISFAHLNNKFVFVSSGALTFYMQMTDLKSSQNSFSWGWDLWKIYNFVCNPLDFVQAFTIFIFESQQPFSLSPKERSQVVLCLRDNLGNYRLKFWTKSLHYSKVCIIPLKVQQPNIDLITNILFFAACTLLV